MLSQQVRDYERTHGNVTLTKSLRYINLKITLHNFKQYLVITYYHADPERIWGGISGNLILNTPFNYSDKTF